MSVTRRHLLRGSMSMCCFELLNHLGHAQSVAGGDLLTLEQVRPPSTVEGKTLYDLLGPNGWTELNHRFQTVNYDIRKNGLRHIPGVDGTLLTGYPYNEFCDWDLYFENLYLSYFGVWEYCFTNLREFLDRQQPDGYINRSLIKQRDRQHFKPFLAQLAVLGCKQNNNNYEWLRGNYFNRLGKYLTKWFTYDGDANGLPTWNSADAAGTDNQWTRAGALSSFEIEGVDLSSYLVRELRAMAVIAGKLHFSNDVKGYNDQADLLIRRMNAVFWDEEDGMYYDRNEKTGKLVKVKSATCFMPLFAGAATPERAKRIVEEHLLNEKEFWLAYPVASYARTEPDYYQGSHNECNWRGPTWAPTNYMIFQGLMRYGYAQPAKILSERLLEMALGKNPVLREYYDAETGLGLGQTRFWGFTSLYYGIRLEWELRYDASSLVEPEQPIVARAFGISSGILSVQIGYCGAIKDLEAANAAGFDYCELRTSEVAALSDSDFNAFVLKLKQEVISTPVAYWFVPADIKLTGPKVDTTEQSRYLEHALNRMSHLGAHTIVFGSSGARNVPDGFPEEEAFRQLVDFGKRTGPIARRYGITIAIEPQCREESNIINTTREALDWVNAVDDPNVQLMIDYYHFESAKEDPAVILMLKDRIQHIHMANPKNRVMPLRWEEHDYGPFFSALKAIGYNRCIGLEATSNDLLQDGPITLRLLRDALMP